jgi:hypothetical protein
VEEGDSLTARQHDSCLDGQLGSLRCGLLKTAGDLG